MKYWLYSTLRIIIKPLFLIIFTPKIVNRDNIPKKGNYILAGNHKHALDPILLGASINKTILFIAKKELHEGIKKHFFKAIGTIPVDRKNKNIDFMKNVIEEINDGYIIGIFPEGTRNVKKEDLPYKHGAVSLAKKTNTPIVPFGIKGKYFPFGGLTITFDKPLDISNLEIVDATEKLKKTVEKLKR